MVLTLYKLDESPPVRSVYMTIEALDLSGIQYVDIKLLEGEHLKEEYLKMNPQHTIPMLKDGDFIIWDSHAIVSYLVTKYGSEDSLYPADPKQRAIIDQRLHFDGGILFPALRGAVEPLCYFGEETIKPEHLAKIKSAYEFSEKFLSSPWMTGDKPTLADICCVSTLSTLNEVLNIDENLYPNLINWMKRCAEQKFYVVGNEPGLAIFRNMIQAKLA